MVGEPLLSQENYLYFSIFTYLQNKHAWDWLVLAAHIAPPGCQQHNPQFLQLRTCEVRGHFLFLISISLSFLFPSITSSVFPCALATSSHPPFVMIGWILGVGLKRDAVSPGQPASPSQRLRGRAQHVQRWRGSVFPSVHYTPGLPAGPGGPGWEPSQVTSQASLNRHLEWTAWLGLDFVLKSLAAFLILWFHQGRAAMHWSAPSQQKMQGVKEWNKGMINFFSYSHTKHHAKI